MINIRQVISVARAQGQLTAGISTAITPIGKKTWYQESHEHIIRKEGHWYVIYNINGVRLGQVRMQREARAFGREHGDKIVFDPKLWGGKDVGDNSQFWQLATILHTYTQGADELADVRFHHDGRISHGHFTRHMREVSDATT